MYVQISHIVKDQQVLKHIENRLEIYFRSRQMRLLSNYPVVSFITEFRMPWTSCSHIIQTFYNEFDAKIYILYSINKYYF